jgi:PD-(D/E)XK nuclease superfamily
LEDALRISYSQYTAFLTNPEKYRLYYRLGLTPEGDDTPTRMNMGRRRGSCFHKLREGEPREALIEKFGLTLVERCEDLALVAPDLGPLFFCEQEFEVPIGDGKHTIYGFIDHGYTNADGQEQLGDYKTTKGTRTKAETAQYFGNLETSSQSHFYLKAAAALGHPTGLFTYHVIFDRKDKNSKPRHVALDLPYIGPAEIERTMAEVYAACETIGFLTDSYGIEKPWPHSNNWPCCGDKAFCGYQGLCGRTLPKGVTPPGFTNKFKDLIQLEAE